MRVAERGKQRANENHGGNVADEIGEDEHGSADGEELRRDGAAESRLEKIDEVRDGAGILEALHNDEKSGEEEEELPIDAAVDVFRFDAANNEDERAGSGGGESEGEIHKPQNEDEDGGDDGFCEKAAIDGDGMLLRLMFEQGRARELAVKNKCEKRNVEKQAEKRDRREVNEKFEKCEMRGDADECVLRIAGDGHDGADVGGSGEGDEIGELGEAEAFGDGEDDGGEHEADGVVDEKCGEDAGGENEEHEKLKGSFGDGGNARGDPVEEVSDLKMRDENHDAEEEDDGVPADSAIGSVEGNDSGENHGDGAAKGRGGAVEMTAASGFDGDEDVGDEENGDGEPVEMRGKREDEEQGRWHEGKRLAWRDERNNVSLKIRDAGN